MSDAMADIPYFPPAEGNAHDDTMGGRIVSAREAAGMTSAELARRLGVKASTLRNWETDRAEPRANRLTMLAGLIGVSPGWLLAGHGESPVERIRPTGSDEIHEELSGLRAEALRLAERIERVMDRLG